MTLLLVGQDPLNRSEVAELHVELRSPVFAAEVASRARSPQVMRPRDKTDHVTDILTLERPGEVVPQVRARVCVLLVGNGARGGSNGADVAPFYYMCDKPLVAAGPAALQHSVCVL
jgi:hypothetical protein